ncbi:hypothetical protein CL644_02570 [bacterium]|nr:hypothetical protein [Parcubacteria group bacterium]MBF05568.1 hypothetical protein [bacterium]|tara:strand:- start:3057 stop:4031 length:975 start_codon:yes stop_codon:yes gene_type:complete
MTFIKHSATNSFATLALGTLFFIAISLIATTATVNAQDWDNYNYDTGWYTGGDTCVNCSAGWDDYSYAADTWDNYNYDTGWDNYSYDNSGWDDYTYYDLAQTNDYQYGYNDYQYGYNDYQYNYPGVIYDDWNTDWNLDFAFDYYNYDNYDYYEPRYYPTYTPSYSQPSSYYNNVVSNVTNTNTNINNNTNVNNVSSGYPVYIPPAQPQPIVRYSYPTTLVTTPQPQPRVTVAAARTGYVNINQIPYTGTNNLPYTAALIVAAFGVGAVLFFRKTGVFSSIELPAFAAVRSTDEQTKTDIAAAEGDTLSLENGNDGPKLSFVKRQ